jgi:DNA-directed RNA polymerase specialized sigma subunit
MARISKQQLIRLQKTLKTDAAIGKKYGITRQAVHQLRQKYNLDYNRKKYQERNRKIAGLYKQGLTGVRIARKTGLSISQVYRIIGASKK